MAPISEKRTSVPHIKENTKENNASTTQVISNNKKTLEIQDFHESWLRDIESYKNQVRIQQMLSTHNHLHTPDGCAAEPNIMSSMGKRRSHTQQNSLDYDAINLKRARDEASSVSATAIHHYNSTTQSHHLKLSHNQASQTGGKNAKIIVNSFHASCLIGTNKIIDSPRVPHHNSNPTQSHSNSNNNSHALGVRLTHHHKSKSNKHLGPPKDDHDGIERLKLILSRPASHTANILNSPRISIPEEHKSESPTPDDDACSHPNVDDDDNNSIDDIGDIDDLTAFEDGSDDETEVYTGYPFVLDSDANVQFMSEAIHSTKANPKSILAPSLFPQVAPYIAFSSHSDKGPLVPSALHKVLKWRLSPVMPRIVRRVIFNSGFRLIKKTTDWMAVWEKHMRSPGFKTIRSHQKFNHMPGSFRIGRKDSMWRNLRTFMTKHGKSEFGFMQKTYILPDELDALKKVWPRAAAQATKWIVKPPASARGVGITVVNKWSQIPKEKPVIVQRYIERPLLINENKFDLRLYVLVTSINPLRIYLYKNGLARFASVKYSSELTSLSDRCMHLTNYSINKLSENYAKNEDINACQGHKWSLQSLWSYLEKRKVDTKRLWATLRNLAIRSIISGEGCLNRMYRQNVNSRYNCYELFGFDVLLDENLVPWLLEINISPSLHSELPLDLHVKGPLIQSVLNTALYQVPPKLSVRQQAEILSELQMTGPLCYDRQLFTPVLSPEETKKHNYYTSRLVECREEYLDSILDNLTPDDVRCLLISEDERARCDPLERIFPNADTHRYLQFIENPRYYNRLLDAWETKYLDDRERGIALLRKLCLEGFHLKVPPAALIEEPKIDLTDIDLMYMKPDEIAKRRLSYQAVDTKEGDKTETAAMAISNNEDPLKVQSTTTTAAAAATTNGTNIPPPSCSAELGDTGDMHTNNSLPITVRSNVKGDFLFEIISNQVTSATVIRSDIETEDGHSVKEHELYLEKKLETIIRHPNTFAPREEEELLPKQQMDKE